MSLVTAENLVKDYRTGDVAVHAIRGVDFTIEPASFVCFVGPSGSGKSTLLNMIGCLDPPTTGRLTVSGTDVSTMSHHTAAEFRARDLRQFRFEQGTLVGCKSLEFCQHQAGTGQVIAHQLQRDMAHVLTGQNHAAMS